MSVSISVFLLRLLIAQELIASFSTNTCRVRGSNFARWCVVEDSCHLWHKRKQTNCVLYAILAPTEKLHFAVNGRFMHALVDYMYTAVYYSLLLQCYTYHRFASFLRSRISSSSYEKVFQLNKWQEKVYPATFENDVVCFQGAACLVIMVVLLQSTITLMVIKCHIAILNSLMPCNSHIALYHLNNWLSSSWEDTFRGAQINAPT